MVITEEDPANILVGLFCRRTTGPTRRSTRGQWTPEEVILDVYILSSDMII